jgi:hypothetical protein
MKKVKPCLEPRYLIEFPKPLSTKALKAFFQEWVGGGSKVKVNVKRTFRGAYHVRVTHKLKLKWCPESVSWDLIVGEDDVAMLAFYKGGSGTLLSQKQLLELDYVLVEE